MLRKTLKCPKCDKKFSRKGPLTWHMQSIHGAKKKRKATAKRAKRRGKRRTTKRVGRPTAIASRLDLKSMTLDELRQVLDAAREEARRRLSELEDVIG